jgi:hypothetical protein
VTRCDAYAENPAQVLPTRSKWATCRTDLANDRACTRFTAPQPRGRGGVDGSSPSEGFRKGQQMVFLIASTFGSVIRATFVVYVGEGWSHQDRTHSSRKTPELWFIDTGQPKAAETDRSRGCVIGEHRVQLRPSSAGQPISVRFRLRTTRTPADGLSETISVYRFARSPHITLRAVTLPAATQGENSRRLTHPLTVRRRATLSSGHGYARKRRPTVGYDRDSCPR